MSLSSRACFRHSAAEAVPMPMAAGRSLSTFPMASCRENKAECSRGWPRRAEFDETVIPRPNPNSKPFGSAFVVGLVKNEFSFCGGELIDIDLQPIDQVGCCIEEDIPVEQRIWFDELTQIFARRREP